MMRKITTMKFQRFVLIVLLSNLVLANTALGYTVEQFNRTVRNSLLYLPNETNCGLNNPGGVTTPGDTLPVGDNAVVAYKFFVDHGLAPFRSAAIIGNLMQESHVNPKEDNPAAKNGGGGIAQWEGDRWSGANGLLAYAAGTGNFTSQGKQGSWNDLGVQLNFMWWEATHTHANALVALKAATTLDDTHQRDGAVTVWERTYEGASIPNMSQRITYAQQVLTDPRMGNSAPASGPADTSPTPGGGPTPVSGGTAPTNSPCVSSDPTQPGNTGGIIGTAMSNLTWPQPACTQDAYGEHRNGCHDATSAYDAAIVVPANQNDAITDCGVFVATVMIKSGSDPAYPKRNTMDQQPYVISHPDKYTITYAPKSTAQLKQGDIIIYEPDGGGPKGHTLVYLGGPGGAFPVAAASWGDHTPHRQGVGGVSYLFSYPGVIAATRK